MDVARATFLCERWVDGAALLYFAVVVIMQLKIMSHTFNTNSHNSYGMAAALV